MLSKAPLTSHSRMSDSRSVITPSWLSGSWRSFLYSSSVYSCHLFLISFGGVVVTNQPVNARVKRPLDSIPRSKRFTGVGNGNPLQYSCLENPMDSEAWLATVHGAKMEFSVDKLRGECKNHLKLYMCVYYIHTYTHILIYIYTYIYIYYICI